MATKKAASATKKKTTTKKSTVVSSPTTTKVTTVRAVSSKTADSATTLPKNLVNIGIAELIGTFILTMVALLSFQGMMPLYVGLTLAALVLTIGAVSGAHVNPAVTFGLWSVRRLKTIMVPFYWAAQLIGAALAVVAMTAVSNGTYSLAFANFGQLNWGVFMIELIGAAIFLFGVVAVTSRKDLSNLGKSLGVGLSLMLGLLVSGSLFSTLQAGVDTSKVSLAQPSSVPHEYRVKGSILNPAIAIASTETTDSQLQQAAPAKGTQQQSRFALETILGALIGAAIGANLWLLVSYRARSN